MKFRIVAMLLGIALTSVAQATILGTVNIQDHNNPYSDQAQLWGGGLTGGTYYTGTYSWVNAGGTDLGTHVPNFGYCIQLTQPATNGWQDVIPLDEAPLPREPLYNTPMGATKANYIRELWGRDFNQNWTTNPTSIDKQMAEAFGAAIWEIIYETDSTWDVTSGAGFHAIGIEQAATANLWLSQLNGDSAYFAPNLVAISDGQDYVVQVPEPMTIAFLTIGAAAILRRNKR
jgi:hypothetical protein